MFLLLLPHKRLQFLDYGTWWVINHNWLKPGPWPLTLRQMMFPFASWTPHDSNVLLARVELQLIAGVWVCCFMESFYLMPQENTALGQWRPALASSVWWSWTMQHQLNTESSELRSTAAGFSACIPLQLYALFSVYHGSAEPGAAAAF